MPSRSEVKSHAKAAELKDLSREISEGDLLVIPIAGEDSPVFTAVSFVGSDGVATEWERARGKLSLRHVEKAYDLSRLSRDAGEDVLSSFLGLKECPGVAEILGLVRTERRVLLLEVRGGGFRAAIHGGR